MFDLAKPGALSFEPSAALAPTSFCHFFLLASRCSQGVKTRHKKSRQICRTHKVDNTLVLQSLLQVVLEWVLGT